MGDKLGELNEALKQEGFSTRLSEKTSAIYFDHIEAHIQAKSGGEFEILEGMMSIQTSKSIDSTVDKIRELF